MKKDLEKQLAQVSRELLKMTKAKIEVDIKLRKLRKKKIPKGFINKLKFLLKNG